MPNCIYTNIFICLYTYAQLSCRINRRGTVCSTPLHPVLTGNFLICLYTLYIIHYIYMFIYIWYVVYVPARKISQKAAPLLNWVSQLSKGTLLNDYSRVGCFSNERRFFVESSLQGILSNSFLRKRTKRAVVMWTWSWRGKPAASARSWLRGSKRRALAIYDSVRIYHMFPIPNCRGKSDLGLCTTSGLAKTIQPRKDEIRRILWPNAFFNRKSPLCRRIVFANPEVVHRPRSDSPLHFEIGNIWQIRTEK